MLIGPSLGLTNCMISPVTVSKLSKCVLSKYILGATAQLYVLLVSAGVGADADNRCRFQKDNLPWGPLSFGHM